MVEENANLKYEAKPLCPNNHDYIQIMTMNQQEHPPSEDFSAKLRNKIWQIFPSFCASLICTCFGLMVGWTSTMYPNLLKPEGVIYISLDQSAMIAGFLMIGVTLGTPFSSYYHLGPKYGIVISASFLTTGWVVMWQAQNIYFLLASRLLVGFGCGYGTGQLKSYIKEMTEDKISKHFIKQMNLFTIFGVILAFAVGPFVGFRLFCMLSLIFTIFALFITIFLPSTPKELYMHGNMKDCRRLIRFLAPHLNPNLVMSEIKLEVENPQEKLPFSQVFKDPKLRKNFIVWNILIFCQQYTGLPSTIVYSQCIFIWFRASFPEVCAIIYIFSYYIVNAFCIYGPTWNNKKSRLLVSNIGVSILLITITLVLYFELDSYWEYTVPILLLLFMILHTIGLGYIPATLVEDYFPVGLQSSLTQYYIMVHSMLALLITKIFQVLVGRLYLYVPFCLFSSVSIVGLLSILLFVP